MPSAADRGTIVHEVLGRFAKAAPETLPATRAGAAASARPGRLRADRQGLSRALRGMVAALRAARRRVPAIGRRSGAAGSGASIPRSPAAGPSRSRTAAPSRCGPAPTGSRRAATAVRDHRFQDRRRPSVQGGLRRLLAAAHARSRDADAGRLPGRAEGDARARSSLRARLGRPQGPRREGDRAAAGTSPARSPSSSPSIGRSSRA